MKKPAAADAASDSARDLEKAEKAKRADPPKAKKTKVADSEIDKSSLTLEGPYTAQSYLRAKVAGSKTLVIKIATSVPQHSPAGKERLAEKAESYQGDGHTSPMSASSPHPNPPAAWATGSQKAMLHHMSFDFAVVLARAEK